MTEALSSGNSEVAWITERDGSINKAPHAKPTGRIAMGSSSHDEPEVRRGDSLGSDLHEVGTSVA